MLILINFFMCFLSTRSVFLLGSTSTTIFLLSFALKHSFPLKENCVFVFLIGKFTFGGWLDGKRKSLRLFRWWNYFKDSDVVEQTLNSWWENEEEIFPSKLNFLFYVVNNFCMFVVASTGWITSHIIIKSIHLPSTSTHIFIF